MKYWILILLVFFQINLFAASVSGRVRDKKSGAALAGMAVGLDKDHLTTETDESGGFAFPDVDPGNYILYVSNGTYGVKRYRIKVTGNFYADLEIERREYSAPSSQFEMTDDLRETRQSITGDDIKRYPGRGIGDSLHLMQTLPGVGGGYSLATVPIIRSNNPLLTKYYIDEIPIDQPYHYAAGFIPLMSSINEQIIDEAYLYKNDAPVWMGDSSGNAIQIVTKEAEQSGTHGSVLLDPFFPALPSVYVNGVVSPKLSYVGSARRSTFDYIADIEDPSFVMEDYYLKTRYVLDSSNRFDFIFNSSHDDLQYEGMEAESGYSLYALKWDFYLKRQLYLKTALSYYQVDRKIQVDDEDGAYVKFDPAQIRLYQALHTVIDPLEVQVGYEYINYRNGVESNLGLQQLMSDEFYEETSEASTISFPIEGNGIAVFTDLGVENRQFWVEGGVRYEYFGVQDTQGVSYHTEAGYYVLKNVAVYGKAGRYIAHPDMLYYLGSLEQDGTGTTLEELTSPGHLDDTTVDSFALGAKGRINRHHQVQGEAFYTIFDNLYPGGTIITVNNDEYRKLAQLHTFASEDAGYNTGFELSMASQFWRRYQTRLSYTYQHNVMNGDDSLFVELLGDDYKDIQSEYNQTHIFRALGSANYGPWTPALVFNAYSSLPYTPVEGTTDTIIGTSTLYGETNSEVYDLHHRLDAKLNYRFSPKGRIYIEWWNVYFNSNNTIADLDNDPSNLINDTPIFLWAGAELCF